MPFAILGVGLVIFALSWAASNQAASSSSSSAAAASPADSTSGNLPDPAGASGSVIKQAAAVFTAAGLTPIAAAGIIGNAYQESSMNSDGVGGLWGFTASPNSMSDLKAYAAQRGVAWTSPTLQAEFLLQHLPSGDIATLNQQSSPAQAASWFMNNWEHPLASTENEARRQQGAQMAYNEISNGS